MNGDHIVGLMERITLIGAFTLFAAACHDAAGHNPAGTPSGQTVMGLIALPTTAFDVKFEWSNSPGKPPWVFEWRQQNGVRRRDALENATTGSFRYERDVRATPELMLAKTVIGCDWHWRAGESNPRAGCATDGASLHDDIFETIDDALRSGLVTARLANREIAGVQAACYSYSAESEGTICVDSMGTPLYFAGVASPSGLRETILATRISRNVPDLILPSPLPPDVAYLSAEPSINVSELQLPN